MLTELTRNTWFKAGMNDKAFCSGVELGVVVADAVGSSSADCWKVLTLKALYLCAIPKRAYLLTRQLSSQRGHQTSKVYSSHVGNVCMAVWVGSDGD